MERNIIFKSKYWEVILANDQYYLGRCILDTKREVGTLRELNEEEWEELHELIKKLEKVMMKIFGAEMFNWSCLMNNAYKHKEKNPKPHVHFHFKPRYKNIVNFAGEKFHDEDFGHHYNDEHNKMVSPEVFDKIKEEILMNLD
jgi:diadenosine tetraphosphate (Ap4A) HIT family hydrolase